MIHVPYRHIKPAYPCMKHAICSKDNPKEFSEVSKSNKDGYPVYKQQNNGQSVIMTTTTTDRNKEQIPMDNRWVVPYNPYLTAFLNTINVKICNIIQTVEYLYKYIYKNVFNLTLLRLIQTTRRDLKCCDTKT